MSGAASVSNEDPAGTSSETVNEKTGLENGRGSEEDESRTVMVTSAGREDVKFPPSTASTDR